MKISHEPIKIYFNRKASTMEFKVYFVKLSETFLVGSKVHQKNQAIEMKLRNTLFN